MAFTSIWPWAALVLAPFIFLVLYVRWNDRALTTIPTSALYFGPKRCTVQDVHATANRLANSAPISKDEDLPLRTGRRYIVVGGGGFLGSWIATKLLQRGEDPHRIRLLDLNSPTNKDVVDALEKGTQFIKVDMTDADALEAAFKAPWPSPNPSRKQPDTEITVFHTAANIRFYERHKEFFDRSTKVNVIGTQNVINASRAAGARVLVYTSSGSVAIHSTRFLRWPWEKEPKRFVQVINDDDGLLPKRHMDFFSNYAASKIQAERLVRAADRTPTGERAKTLLRTGCIRPGNGVFGPRGDMLCGAYLVRKNNPTWINSVVQSFSYVENCAAAHLCYEARLIDLLEGSANPDIGGQAFCIADPGTTPTYGDVYTTLETLTAGECHFPQLSPTAMLIFSHVIEAYYRMHFALLSQGWKFASFFPAVKGDIINLQPSLFALTSVHLIFDDSRARLAPEKGGLGYSGAWTTIEGLHKTVDEYKSGVGRSDTRSDTAGVSFSFGFKFLKKDKANVPTKMAEKVNDSMPGVAPVEVVLPVT
ncbi:NAD-P-binding protein [Pholiota conissans]|uniref:NAD-P-binding protein n=1 Tax=Pholiota conissans TaxID=109636 RepID=A0A9P5Z687_9AGAR|nr:NAD-P-binding protein [Pholiota conissans]